MAPGFPPADHLAARYAARSGRDISSLPYYVAFARWRGACIWHGVAARYRAGVMGDDGFAQGAAVRDDSVAVQARAVLEALSTL
jgi:aminoglycoside phosphotransferase (APT) family kinase protein